jgi:hypothetical protein
MVRQQRFDPAVPVEQLTPHPMNPREGDVGEILGSIQANGFFGAVLAQEGTGIIIAGEHRWRAAQMAGETHVPVLYCDGSSEEITRMLLADNRTSDKATWVNTALKQVLDGLNDSPQGLAGSGFSPEDYDAVIRDLEQDLKLDQLPVADKPKKSKRPKFELVFETDGQLTDFQSYLSALADLYPQHDGHERRLLALLEDAIHAG